VDPSGLHALRRAAYPAGVPLGEIQGENMAQLSVLQLEERDLKWIEE